ncbi:Spy/CpxP family protein refolding chaperone [Massilia sp. SR12]
MKKSRIIPLLLAAAIALPLACVAAEGEPPIGERGQHGPGPGHRFGPSPGMHFLRGLDLSDSQEDKLFQLMHSQAPYLREQQRAHEKAMQALHEMRNAEKFDDAAASKLAQAAAQAQANITLAHVRTHQKVLALLTPEQRKQLEERKARPQRGGGFHER